MTHTQRSNIPFIYAEDNWEMLTLDYFTISPAYMELNYGMFEIPIKRSEGEVVVKASVRGITGDEIY